MGTRTCSSNAEVSDDGLNTNLELKFCSAFYLHNYINSYAASKFAHDFESCITV